VEAYQQGVLDFIDRDAVRRRGLKLVIDYSYGSAATIFPAILGQLGCEVIALNAYMDERRVTKSAEEFQRSLKQLCEIVRILGADLGVMLDTGAEKLFLVDDKGDLLSDDLALAAIALLVTRTQPPGRIGVPITASAVLERLVEPHGFSVTRTRIAPRAQMEAAAQEGMVLVGDAYGGFIFPRFQPAFDAMLATMKILELLALSDLTLHEAIRQIPKHVSARDQVPCPWEMKGTLMRLLIEGTKHECVELVDGVKIHLGSEWVIVYPDQEKPFFHIVAEAEARARAEQLVGLYRDQLRAWLARGAPA
jgi:mannose-1-phosphate guanylyltransferase/phosphomannomutase